jgi:hypothetical protein
MLRSTSRVRPAGAACKASWLLWMWTVDLRVRESPGYLEYGRPYGVASRCVVQSSEVGRVVYASSAGKRRGRAGEVFSGIKEPWTQPRSVRHGRHALGTHCRFGRSFFLRGQKRGWSAEGVDPMQGKATTSETTLALARAAATGRCVPAGPAPDKAATPTGVAMAHGGGAVVEPRVGGRPRAPRIL